MQPRGMARFSTTVLAAIAAVFVALPGEAQVATQPLIQVAPGVYRSGLVLPGTLAPQPVQYGAVSYGGYVYGASQPTRNPVLARMDAPFRLKLVDEGQLDDFVTRAHYAANNVVVTLAPSGGYGRAIRLVGRMDVVTETTLNEEGNGSVQGLLTFTSRNRNGYTAQILSLNISGEVNDNAGPLRAEGVLNIANATATGLPLVANVSATLSSDANLTSRLTGMAEVTDY